MHYLNMALIDKASLLMVPSTYEAGTLYNVLPSGNRAPDSTDQNSGYDQTRADFTFDRGSNAAATRVNSDGLIEKYRENLLTFSNDFSNAAWVKSNASVTSGQSGYDGTNNAWLLKGNTSNLAHRVYNAVSNTNINTLSVYVKASGHNYIQILSGNTINQYANFDLSDGSIGNSGSNFTPKIESVGNDWYRISAFNNSSLVYSYIQLVSSKTAVWNESWSMPNDTDGVLIQNAQAELGLVATDYLDSGATTAKAGVLIDLPRINYDANGENGALLLEPSRQQLIQYSEYFGDSYWTKTGSSVVSGFTSPEGLGNAYKLVENTSFGGHYIVTASSISVTSGSAYTQSIFVKPNGRTKIGFRDSQGSGKYASFNLSNGTLIEQNGDGFSIDSFENDWYKISVTMDASGVNWKPTLYLLPDSYTTGSPQLTTYAGDGTSGVYIFGAQLEAGSYSTSYIPNHGTSGGVTRAADSCSVTGVSDVIGQTEGTIFWEGGIDDFANYATLFALEGTSNSWIYCLTYSAGFTFEVRSNNVVTAAYSPTFTTGSHKIALAYNASQVAIYIDGVSVFTDFSVIIPATSNLYLAGWVGYNQAVKTAQVLLFNERLTNEELATLTTL